MLQFAKSLVSKGLDVSLVTFCGNKPMAVQDYSSVKLDDPGANNLLQKKRRQLPQAWPVSTVFYMVGLPLLQAHDLPSFVYDIQVYLTFTQFLTDQFSSLENAIIRIY
ncbi:hypothetical protein V6N12_035032 [Hibiscus sabdariffa]|uniref:Uncharacterized protein n=1 Tax=Hibiscus sabdariffa TaxID=183260 RepID=A0ABR2A0B4_9ROSI